MWMNAVWNFMELDLKCSIDVLIEKWFCIIFAMFFLGTQLMINIP